MRKPEIEWFAQQEGNDKVSFVTINGDIFIRQPSIHEDKLLKILGDYVRDYIDFDDVVEWIESLGVRVIRDA